jgi:hypothetical protein
LLNVDADRVDLESRLIKLLLEDSALIRNGQKAYQFPARPRMEGKTKVDLVRFQPGSSVLSRRF